MNPLKRHVYLLLVLATLLAIPAAAQKKRISGIVKDSHSEERIPFASVSFKNSTIGTLTDSAGFFAFAFPDWPSDTLAITCVGYQPFFLVIPAAKDSVLTTVLMERGTFNEGVKVKVKVNKGLLMWRRIVK